MVSAVSLDNMQFEMKLYIFLSTELLEIWFPKFRAHLWLFSTANSKVTGALLFKVSDSSTPLNNSSLHVLRAEFRIAFIITFTLGNLSTGWVSANFKEFLKLHTKIFTDRMI